MNKMRRSDFTKKRKFRWKEHIDYEWINKKIDGHGGVYSYKNPNGVIIINWIYGKNHIQIFWYNIILFIKYLIRITIKC
jgi:hypothetical protein